MKDDELLVEVQQAVAARAAATSDFSESAFAALVAEHLVDTGAINGFDPVQFIHRGMRVDGYAMIDDEATLDLFVVEWSGSADEISSLTKTTLEDCFKRAENFFDKAVDGDLAHQVDVGSSIWAFARQLGQIGNTIARVRINILSDCKLSSQVKTVPSKVRNGRTWTYRIWDLLAIGRLITTNEPEDIEIDFVEMFGRPLPCLPANTGQSGVESYLTVIPGDWLARIYEQYSGRLLEQNVRTFLQVNGSVNKGIRRTILEEPEMFFAYNNGISATAEAAILDRIDGQGMLNLCKVKHLQVVNGGQTTASIFNVLMKHKDKASNLERIHVQMKLSVVRSDQVTEIVPRISVYANSQNKVSAADFFSNHPYHIRVEGCSRRIWAPAVEGTQQQTHWFYERARGQFANAVTYLTPAKKKEFEATHPRRQLIQKTDLAKAEMTWLGFPHVVSQGAQKNFGRFAEWVANRWKDDGIDFGDDWFREAVARIIVFRTLERLVQEAPWYAQGYRANIVTYAIALLQHAVSEAKRGVDFKRIWNQQCLSAELSQCLLAIAEKVQSRLVAAASDYQVVNVTEWAKREKCWDDLKSRIPVDLSAFKHDLVDADEVAGERRQQRKDQREMNGVEAQMHVVNQGAGYWASMLRWAEAGTVMSPGDLAILSIGASVPRKLPTPAQCIRLIQIESKAKAEGFRSKVY